MEKRLNELDRVFADEGLEFLGVASVDASADIERDRYRQFLSEGKHGTMTFLERHEPGKYDPGFSLEGCRSVIVAGMSYFQARRPLPAESGLVARYAWGRDYHKVFLAKLKRVAERLAKDYPEERWRTFTDTAPLDERYWAQRAGASFTARNTLAINRRLGSWFLIGEVLTTRAFEATGPAPHRHGSCPSGCRRCHDVCPTGALDKEGRIDARLCISYLTIEHKGPIQDALKPQIGSWLFGCDLCQDVCPFNLAAPSTREPEFLAWKAGPDLHLEEILALEPESFTARFGGSPVHRAGRNGLVRNACLVAANTGAAVLLPRLETLTGDTDEGVADAARWAIARLRNAS